MSDAKGSTGDGKDLQHLQEEIDEVRHDVDEAEGRSGRHFIDDGTEGTETVDDAIAPPG